MGVEWVEEGRGRSEATSDQLVQMYFTTMTTVLYLTNIIHIIYPFIKIIYIRLLFYVLWQIKEELLWGILFAQYRP